ncbi:GIY-YIG nuclease family protein [Patescibacteria group bacterium]|nr:GIY-YIG nuclease family protein [Patescibacteria group bacterium]
MKYIVYILQSLSAKKSYVGVTDNIERRIKEHNSGKHFYTKRHTPWKVIHTEEYSNFQEAQRQEKYLKTTSGRRIMKKIFDSIKT